MFWVVLGTIVTYLIINLPLLYSLKYVHGFSGIGKLWGYAPNQFLFSVIIFPFASLFSFFSFVYFVKDLYSKIPLNSKVAYFFDQYPAFLLFCLIAASSFALIVYYTSAWSFDKLEPKYTEKTFQMVREFEVQVEAVSNKKEEQDQYRKRLIGEAKDKLKVFEGEIPPDYNPEQIDQMLNSLEPTVFLQVMHSKDLTHKLRLVNPTIKILNVLQLFTTLLIGAFLIFVSIVCLMFAREINYDGTNHAELKQMFNLVFWAVFYFSLYSICFRQYRYQIEELVGTGTTVLQDILVLVIVLVILIGIKYVETHKFEFSLAGITPFLPIVLPFAGITVESLAPDMMKQYIGTETTLGFQVIFSILFSAVSIVIVFVSLKPQ